MTLADLHSMLLLAAAESDEYGEHGGGHSDVFPPFDPAYFSTQLFWLAVTFGILFLLLWKVFLPRVGTMIEERRDRIADDLDAASRMQAEAEAAEAAYTKALADARAKAHAVAETTRGAVNAEIEKETAAAEAEAQERQEAAEARIREATASAMSSVKDVAKDAAQDIVEKLTGNKVTKTRLNAAIKSLQS